MQHPKIWHFTMRSIQNVRTNVIPHLKRFDARRGLNMIQHLIL